MSGVLRTLRKVIFKGTCIRSTSILSAVGNGQDLSAENLFHARYMPLSILQENWTEKFFAFYDDGSFHRGSFERRLASFCRETAKNPRSRPSARHRFMPRPRKSTEMRPSMPARKRCPFLNSGLFSSACCGAVLLPPRCGMQTSFTSRHALMFSSLKKPRSELYQAGAKPKVSL